MKTNDIQFEIENLRAKINRHNHLYYVLDNPEISDAEYDGLMQKLLRLEEEYPQFLTPESPTQRVGAAPLEAFGIIEHKIPLLSLANVFSKEELDAWYKRISKMLGGQKIAFVCEHKMDGLSVSLTYINGKFITGATRGDGYKGENITQNLKTIKSIPLVLPDGAPSLIEVRGEVFIPRASFEKLNNERAAEGLPLFANPRNAAAGSLRQLDSSVTAERPLDINVYTLAQLEGAPFAKTHHETLNYIQSLGFKINPNTELVTSIEEVEQYYQEWEEKRDDLVYEADGIVVKVDSIDLQQELGNAGREPRWAVAYKFPAIQAYTVLKEIRISVGRTGTLNPYAVLEPISVGGVVIKQATLHNEDDIRRKDIREGDTVIIQRAGDVIPQVIGPVAAKRPALSAEFNMLAKTGGVCPECESAIHKPEGEVMYYCSNASCPAQAMLKIEHFASRPAMDIRGIGEKMSVLLFKEGLVSNFADLYTLKDKRAHLLAIDRMAEKSVDNLLEAIEKSKTRPLPNLIFAMGIRHVGEETAHILAEKFGSIAAIAESTAEQLEEIPAIGPKIADSIVTYFSNPQNKEIIKRLGESGVSMRFESKAKGERPLEGKEFVITGKLSSMPRPLAEEKIKQLGGTAKGDLTRKTDFLVVGEDPGSKLERAEKMNIKIINESEFLELLK
ncbi:MAG: NAD-dependent DNA ligase LigA [Dehalococcoidales bacterium]